jgi:hypothetical protein
VITSTRPCKRCGKPFEQAAVRGRPWAYCSVLCKEDERRHRNATCKRDRYRALRAAGVPPRAATIASAGPIAYAAAMQLLAEGVYG